MQLRKLFLFSLIFVCALFSFSFALAKKIEQPLFETETALEVTLRADLTKVFNSNFGYGIDNELFPAALEYLDADGKTIQQELKIARRGALRGSTCPIRPLKFDFGKRVKTENVFKGLKELKLVTHCGANIKGTEYDEILRAEYLLYKIHNIVTDRSFRVRLLRLRYEDTSGKLPVETHDAFLIENLSDLAARVDAHRAYAAGEAVNKPELIPYVIEDFPKVHPRRMTEVRLFQGLIGNGDYYWNHNTKGIKDIEGFDIIPYDFDLTNFFFMQFRPQVDSSELRCLTQDHQKEVVEKFLAFRAAIEDLVKNTPLIPESRKDLGLKNAATFFDDLGGLNLDSQLLTDKFPCPRY